MTRPLSRRLAPTSPSHPIAPPDVRTVPVPRRGPGGERFAQASDTRGHAALAELIREARLANPQLEFWLDSHPRIGAQRAAAETAVASTLRRCGPSPDGSAALATQLTGITTNPNLIADFDAAVRDRAGGRPSCSAGTRDARYRAHIASAAEVMRDLHARSGGRYGWVSAQVNPVHTFDACAIVEEGMRLASIADNVMVKVPGSLEGYRAIRTLVGAGVSVNGTLSFGLPQFEAFATAAAAGRSSLTADENARTRTVVTHMAGRVGDAVRSYYPPGATSTRELRLAEAALARQGSCLVEQIDPRTSILLSSVRVDRGAAAECMHLSATLDRPVAYTLRPDTFTALEGTGLDQVFHPDETLLTEVDNYAPGPDAPEALRPLFNRALLPEAFWTLPQFLQTLAEASSSQLKLIGGRHSA